MFYDARGFLIKTLDQTGNITQYNYNDIGKISEVIDACGGITQYEYDNMWNVSKIIKADGSYVTYKYNLENNLDTVIDEEGNSKSFKYDANGNITCIKDGNGNETSIVYDALNRVVCETDANQSTTKYEYTNNGLIKKVINAQGSETSYEYDNAGQLLTKKNAEGYKIEYLYDDNGNVKVLTDERGNKTKYEYNNNGKVIKIVKADGSIEEIKYNKNGNISEFIDSNKNITTYFYDVMDRVTSIENSYKGKKSLQYTKVGKISAITDENGNKIFYKYDKLNRLKEVVNAKGITTSYIYDLVGNLIQIEQYKKGESIFNKTIIKYKYDKRGLLIQEKDSMNRIKSYTYDANGNLITEREKDGQFKKYSYDSVNNLTKIIYDDKKQIECTYDELNQITSIRDWIGTTKFEINSLGRITKIINNQNKMIGYSYDESGNRKSIKYPDGSVIKYEYDTMNRLTKVINPKNEITQYKYDDVGNLIETVFPNGIKTINLYDKLSRIIDVKDYSNDGRLIDNYKYTYDFVGNINEIDMKQCKDYDLFNSKFDYISEGKIKYKYDELNQLTEVINPDNSIEKYCYDEFGNRAEKQYWNNNKIINKLYYKYNERNELIEIVGKSQQLFGKDINGPVTLEYDTRGNLTQVEAENQVISKYEYDCRNKLVYAIGICGTETKYSYDGLGNRIKVETQYTDGTNQDCNYLFDNISKYDNVLVSYNNQEMHNYNYGINLIEEIKKNINNKMNDLNTEKQLSQVEYKYYMQNELGSTKRIIDRNGRTSMICDYDVFGQPLNNFKINSDETKENNIFSFTGYQYDEDTNLMYANARYYMPAIGRFISEDNYRGSISNPASLNWYVYCNSNPVNRIDPDGNDSYVFYDGAAHSGMDENSGFGKEAEDVKREFEQQYKSDCQMIKVNSAKEFAEKWNSKVGFDSDGKKVNVDAVELIFHGSADYENANKVIGVKNLSIVPSTNGIGYMYLGNDKSSKIVASSKVKGYNSKTDVVISNLEHKEMDQLIFSSCNSGNPDIQNTGNAFRNIIYANKIQAFDGGALYENGVLKAGYSRGEFMDWRDQATFWRFSKKTWYLTAARKRQGIVYLEPHEKTISER